MTQPDIVERLLCTTRFDGGIKQFLDERTEAAAEITALRAEVALLRSARWAGVIPLIEQITAEEGASVAFVCPNPDFNGQPNEAVTVFQGEDWQDVTYRADTLAECLRAALANKEVAGNG